MWATVEAQEPVFRSGVNDRRYSPKRNAFGCGRGDGDWAAAKTFVLPWHMVECTNPSMMEEGDISSVVGGWGEARGGCEADGRAGVELRCNLAILSGDYLEFNLILNGGTFLQDIWFPGR